MIATCGGLLCCVCSVACSGKQLPATSGNKADESSETELNSSVLSNWINQTNPSIKGG